MSRGSEWRKWDLHVHTPESFHHEFRFASEEEGQLYGGDIWEKFVTELENIRDVSVIGITDYFTIGGYKKALDYREGGRLGNVSLILPNIEFRLDTFLASNTDRKLNFHVIFSDEVNPDNIEREFLQELHIRTHTGEERTLNRQNIEELGRTLKEHHEPFKDKSDYFVGCMNITVSVDEITKILDKKKMLFGGKYILTLPEERWCEISWDGQDHLTRKRLFVKSHALFSSNENTRDWALGRKEVSKEKFLDEFCSLKPCIHGSDAHSFDRLCVPDEDRFCWIKSDPTFEGLKQICYEPETRVRIQKESPEPRKSIYTLNSAAISNSEVSEELSLLEQNIPFNSNLVAVIGGKGSGKTALLDLIANCFEDRCKRSGIDQNSFIQRIEDQKPGLAVLLNFLIGEQFSKSITEQSFFPESQITYLPQGKIEEYSSDRTELHEKISEIIFLNKDVVDAGYKEKRDQCDLEINILVNNLGKLNQTIFSLKEDTAEGIVSTLNASKNLLKGNLKDKTDELQKLMSNIGPDSKEKVEQLRKEEVKLNAQYRNYEQVKDVLIEIQEKIENLYELNRDIDAFNVTLKEVGIQQMIQPLDFEPQLKALITLAGHIQKSTNTIVTGTGDIIKELSKLDGFEKGHAELLKEIDEIKTEIKTSSLKLVEIDKKRALIVTSESERKKTYIALIMKYSELKSIYDEIILTFSKGKDEILSNIDFKSSIFFDEIKYNQIAEDIFDLRKITIDQIKSLPIFLKTIISEPQDSDDKIGGYISAALGCEGFLLKSRSITDLYSWVFSDYFSLGTEVYFGGIHMDKLSIGQKGTVLLKILLAEGDYPLIIDQPEENLDNKFIYEFLVDAFKKAKDRRQIIIATHNANLVVNTDAEQVIVAEFDANEISYRTGSIENPEIRKEITTLLEGGEEAFKKREMKYGYAG